MIRIQPEQIYRQAKIRLTRTGRDSTGILMWVANSAYYMIDNVMFKESDVIRVDKDGAFVVYDESGKCNLTTERKWRLLDSLTHYKTVVEMNGHSGIIERIYTRGVTIQWGGYTIDGNVIDIDRIAAIDVPSWYEDCTIKLSA